MEAVPRLHMLWFALKSSPEGTSFLNLKKYIAEFYQEDPETYSKEVFALETLRNQAMHTTKDGSGVMKRYYCQLHSLQNRFPQLTERGIFSFTWKDLYQNNINEVSDMRYELAAVLFNIAASHTQSGASVTRGDVDGMKMACTHFQCAAWAFGELRERYAHVNSGNDFMCTELLVFMQQVCYAQAQECILEKSLIDNRKPNIVAKVTAQIVVYYGAALAALLTGGDDGPIAQVVEASVYKLWKKYVRFKICYLNCILYLYQGQHAEEQRKMGERVTLYQAAWDKLEEARKESKGLPDQKEINESLIFTADVVEAKRKNAKNENEFIYHEAVPELSTISAVQGANLVNGISFSVTDPEVAGDDIFARLVPMKAHEASSMYSEEKAKLLRKYGAMIEEKDTELTSYMSSLTLDNLNINEEKANKLPQGIVDRCAALNANKTAISDLIAAMSQLAEITADVETNLNELANMLKSESQEEHEFLEKTGVLRTPNPHITELTREYQKYSEAHARAGESNNTLRKAMSLHVNNLKILARPLQEIQQMMPKLSAELNTTEIFKDVKLIVNKVNEMKAQRAQFHADLRIAVNEDDITAKVIAHGTEEGLQTLFEREIAKHERLTQLIEQNLLAQQNILQALTESYAKAAPVLKTLADVKQKRENFFSSLAASYDVYEDLLAKSAKGLEFYKKLAGNVQKLYTRFKAARDVQSEERQQRLKSVTQAPNVGVVQPTTKQGKSNIAASAVANAVAPHITSGSVSGTGGGTPKLRDYLAAKNTSAASIAAAGVGAGLNDIPPSAGPVYVPPVRPVPVGSENPTQAACSGNNTGGSAYYSGTSGAPNEPPPPYSLQQQQYYDPSAAGYTNPMYQQQQQHIAPPAYKLQASPNSQFSNLNANMSNLSLQGQNYDNQTQYQQQQMQQQQLQNYNYMQAGRAAAGIGAPAAANNANFDYAANTYAYGGGQQQYVAMPNAAAAANNAMQYGQVNSSSYQQPAGANAAQQQQTAYNAATQAMNYQPNYAATSATAAPSSITSIPTTQPLYVSMANAEQVANAPYAYNPNQQQLSTGVQQQQSLAMPQGTQPVTATLPPQQQTLSNLQEQHAQLGAQSQLGVQSQHLMQQQQITPQPQIPLQPTMQQQQQLPSVSASVTAAAAAVGGDFLSYARSASNHPGYSFNPQTGIYEYGSGYQQGNINGQQLYGQFTVSGGQQTAVVGTTDSETANKMNVATGFDSPIISHTKAATGAATATSAAATDSPKSTTEGVTNPYYAMPYGYHSSGAPQNYMNNSGQSANYGMAPQAPTIQQPQPAPQPTMITQPQQQQQQQQPTQQRQKSIYMQSGRSTIANTQTTQSNTEYASSAQQKNVAAETEPTTDVAAAPAPAPAPAAATQPAVNKIPAKKSSNIDLLSDIDFTGMPAPMLPPVLQPQVVSSPPSSQVAAPIAKPNEVSNKPPDELATLSLPPTTSTPPPATAAKTASVFQLTSPTIDSPAARKSSIDNLSNCSDLSSLENFDWDSVSVVHTANNADNKHSAITFQMRPQDPFTDDKTLKYFHKEVERYEKLVEGLHVKMLNGHTQLSAKWKELQDLLAKDASKRSTSIAKLFPEKNRSLDCLPYDHARVKLERDTDDYINAAYLKNLGAGCPNLIIAQTPQQNTLNDFWSMIWSKKSRTICCLHTANEMLDPYWPQQLQQSKHYDDFTVQCIKVDNLTHCMAYQLKLSMHGADPIIDLTVLQIKQWIKASSTQVLGIAQNALEIHQERCLEFNTPASPLILNCLTGSERSELVAIGICAILATQMQRPTLINVVDVWSRICAQRQNSIRDSATLEQSMQLVLNHAHDVLNKRGIMTSYQVKIAPQVASKEQQEMKDPLNELDPLWKLK